MSHVTVHTDTASRYLHSPTAFSICRTSCRSIPQLLMGVHEQHLPSLVAQSRVCEGQLHSTTICPGFKVQSKLLLMHHVVVRCLHVLLVIGGVVWVVLCWLLGVSKQAWSRHCAWGGGGGVPLREPTQELPVTVITRHTAVESSQNMSMACPTPTCHYTRTPTHPHPHSC